MDLHPRHSIRWSAAALRKPKPLLNYNSEEMLWVFGFGVLFVGVLFCFVSLFVFLYLCALLLFLFITVQPLMGDLRWAILLDQVAVNCLYSLLFRGHSDFHEVEPSGDWPYSQVDRIAVKQQVTGTLIFLKAWGLVILGSHCTGRKNLLMSEKSSSTCP